MLQLSLGLGQRTWHGKRDPGDDCAYTCAAQGIFAATPWLRIPSIAELREHANDPDDGNADGGDKFHREMRNAVIGVYPIYRGKMVRLVGEDWSTFANHVRSERPVAVALMPGKLSPRLRHGVGDVPHECIVGRKPNGTFMFWNPWNDTGERWDDLDTLADLRPAIEAYGNGKVYGLAFPSAKTMLPFHPAYSDAVHAIKMESVTLAAQVETLSAQLAACMSSDRETHNSAVDGALSIVSDAAAKIAATKR